MRARNLWLGSMLLLGACAHSQSQPEAPAVITVATAESRAELRAAIAGALGVDDVTIADDAFTQSSTLFIERAQRRDVRGQPLDGREPGRPERFELILSSGRCVLIHVRENLRTSLRHSHCIPYRKT